MDDLLDRAKIIISGRVQGVFMRVTGRKFAQKLGLNGSIKNLSTGQVETVVEGLKEKITRYIDWCHSGSDLAKVTEVNVIWEKYKGEFEDFKITR